MKGIFEKAVAFAFKAHDGQLRKGGGMYVLHPLEVATIVGTMSNDEELLAAAVLHDTVEDTATTIDDIRRNFGERVAALVAHETENKREELPASATWKIRKEESLAVLQEAPVDVKKMWLGDKLSNLRSLASSFDEIGVKVFDRFNQKDPAEQRWYYAQVLDNLADLSSTSAYKEFQYLFEKVFGNIR